MKHSYTVRHKENYVQIVFHVKNEETDKWEAVKVVRFYPEEKDIRVFNAGERQEEVE